MNEHFPPHSFTRRCAVVLVMVTIVWGSNPGINRHVMADGTDASRPRQPVSNAIIPQNPRLGLNVSFLDSTLLQLARNSGSSYDRVDFPMADIQPKQGTWNWSAYDALVSADRSYGQQVLGILTAPPLWAAPVNAIPSGLDLPWNDPGNLWAQHVYQVALHFNGTVSAWQIWNEPDLDKYWPGPPGALTLQDRMRPFAQLMKVSYQAIKAANPNSIVSSPGLLYRVGGGTQGQPRDVALWQDLQSIPEGPANHYFFDVVAFHLYDGGTCEVPGPNYYDVINDFRANVVPWVGNHPLWITESGIRQAEVHGFGTLPPATDRYATLEEAASYVIQNYAYALYQDTQRYYYFRTRDDGGPENWGLVRSNNTPRPSYVAYQIAAQYLPPTFTFATRVWSPSGQQGPISRISFWGTPLGRVSVIWNVSAAPQTYVFASRLPTVTQVVQSADGSRWDTSTLVSSSKQFTFTLEAAPNFSLRPDICLVASRPYILIEPDVTPPTSTLNALPVTTTQTTIPLTWTGSDDLSGIWSYDLQYQVDNGNWAPLQSWIYATSYVFSGQPGHRYAFRVRARDNTGNEQDWAGSNVVSTAVISVWASAAFLPMVTNATVQAPLCSNPIANGGFEQDVGWAINPTPSPAIYTLGIAHSGARAMQTGIPLSVTGILSESFSSVSQTLQLPAPGVPVSLALWRNAQASDTNDAFYIRMWDQYGALHTLTETSSAPAGWQPLSFDLTPYSGQRITLLLGTHNNGDGLNAVAFYDDVAIVCAAAQ